MTAVLIFGTNKSSHVLGTSMLTDFSVQDRGPFKERATVSFHAGTSEMHPEHALESKTDGSGALGCVLVLGPNSSGKSVLLESLGKLTGIAAGEPVPSGPEGFAFASGHSSTEISVSVNSRLVPYVYSISYSSGKVVSESLYQYVTGRRSMVFVRSGNEFRFGKGVVKNRRSIKADGSRSFLSAAAESGDEACSDFLKEIRGMQTEVRPLEESVRILESDGELKSVVLRALRLTDFRVSDISLSEDGAVV